MELRPNRVKRKLATGDIAYIAVGMTDPDDIDAFGPCGFDGVWLEGEHGAVDAANLGNLTRACDIWGLTSIVRVNANDQGLILPHLRPRRARRVYPARQYHRRSAECGRRRQIHAARPTRALYQPPSLWS